MLAYLKHRNANGAHIYMRPTGEGCYTLLDDLTPASLAHLAREGYRPAAVIETSPGNFQAWLHHEQPLPKELGTLAAKILTEQFGADASAATRLSFASRPTRNAPPVTLSRFRTSPRYVGRPAAADMLSASQLALGDGLNPTLPPSSYDRILSIGSVARLQEPEETLMIQAMRKKQRTVFAVSLRTTASVMLLIAIGSLGAPCLQAQSSAAAFQALVLPPEPYSSSAEKESSLPDAPKAPLSAGVAAALDELQADSTPSLASSRSNSFPTFQHRGRHFLVELIGPTAFIEPAFESGIDSARHLVAPGQHPAHGSVPECGEGAQGYAKCYADRFGLGLIGTTTHYALGEVLREDVTYHRCQCTGLLPRTGHALLGAYLARTRGGHTVPSLPALASPFVASEVAVTAWYSSRFNTSALRKGLLNYIAAPFKNLA